MIAVPRRHGYAFALCLLFIAPRSLRADRAALSAQIDGELAAPGLAGATVAVLVEPLDTGPAWYARNADLRLMPASNQKLLTCAAALQRLGPAWRCTTTLLKHGKVDDDGALHGDLVLQGGGDPYLTTNDLEAMADAVRAAGIRRITGRVVGDGSRFGGEPLGLGWEWDDLAYYYAAPVGALTLDGNTVTVEAHPGRRAGDPVRARFATEGSGLLLLNGARTIAAGAPASLSFTRLPGSRQVTITGNLAVGSPEVVREAVTVDRPARFAAGVLTALLRKRGIAVGGAPAESEKPIERGEVVASHDSPPFAEYLSRLLKPSDNLAAECLLRSLAPPDTPATVDAGRTTLQRYLASIGVAPGDAIIADGSGLSRHNLVPARALTAVLRAARRSPEGRLFVDALPIAGVDGSLRNRMKGTPAEGNCHAKTGSLTGASSLSGYVTTRDGAVLVFALVMNNQTDAAAAREAQDHIVMQLASYSERETATAR